MTDNQANGGASGFDFGAFSTAMEKMAEAMSVQAAAISTAVTQNRPCPTVPVALFLFDGDRERHRASEWLGVLSAVASVQGWNDNFRLMMAQSHLKGPAQDWYVNTFPIDAVVTWQIFEAKFKSFFVQSLSRSDRWEKMKKRTQRSNESITSYYLEKYRMCKELDFDLSEIKSEIIQGLNKPESAVSLLLKVHETSEELWNDLLLLESLYKKQGPQVPVRRVPVVPNPETGINTETPNGSDKKRAICYNCQEIGHYASACTKPKVRVCFKCKKPGHEKKDCPEQARVQTGGTTSSQYVVADRSCSVSDSLHKFLRVVEINGIVLTAMVDPGSSVCTITDSALEKGVSRNLFHVRDAEIELFGFGTDKPSVMCQKLLEVRIKLDDVFAEDICLYVVPDSAQKVDVIVGRSFTELPQLAYTRVGNKFTIGWSSAFPFLETVTTPDDPARETLKCLDDVKLDKRSIHLIDTRLENVTISVPVANETDRSIQLYKNDVIGRVCRDLCDSSPVTEEPTQKKPIETTMLNVDDSLSPEQVQQLVNLCNEFRDCFALQLSELGCTNLIEVEIQDSDKPVQKKPYRVSLKERETIKDIVREWKNCGIVTETNSAYATPVILVGKQDGKQRLVGDYRFLNQQTVRKTFPIPTIDEQMECLFDAKMFTVLDLAHGFLQVPLAEKSKEKTAFITPDETGQFERMVFGLVNGPYEFSRLMNLALGNLRNRVAINYLDDILIPAPDWSSLLVRLRLVFVALQKARLTLKLSKCSFGLKTVSYLGFTLSGNGMQPSPDKLKAISDFSVPTDVSQVRRFIGLTSFFRRFIPEFAVRAKPLSDLTKRDVPFVWGTLQSQAFDDLRMALCNSPVLKLYNPAAEVTEVHTDASSLGFGGVLMQSGSDDCMHPVYYVSKKTTETESRYHSSKLELMAIVWTIDRLRNFLIGLKFVVVTDCQALVYLNAHKTKDPQIARWCNLLQEYDFIVRYRPEARMAHVDALSRCPVESPEDTLEDLYSQFDILSLMTEDEYVSLIQKCDEDLKSKILILKKPVEDRTKEEKNETQEYLLEQGRLLKEVVVAGEKRQLYVVPKSVRKSLLVRFHNMMGHFGLDRTVARIMEKYWFPRLRNYVKNHIRSCAECLISKSPGGKLPGLLNPIPLPKRPFERVHLDHLGPFITTGDGNTFILALIDAFTKYIRLYAVPSTACSHVVRCIRDFVADFGVPKRFVSDRGTCFTSESFTAFCEELGVNHTKISSQRPQANGQIERVNRVLISTIMTIAEEDQWDLHLKDVERNCNTAINRTTGKSPFQLLYGYCPSFYDGPLANVAETDPEWTPPDELRNSIRERVFSEQQKSKLRYDRSRFQGTAYTVGDIVMVKRLKVSTGTSTKLQRKYKGPMVIMEVLPNDVYRVSTLDDDIRTYSTTVHVSQLKLCTNPDDEEENSTGSETDTDDITEHDPETPNSQPELDVSDCDVSVLPQNNEQNRPRRKTELPSKFKDYVVDLS